MQSQVRTYKLIVCGARRFDDRQLMDNWLWLFRHGWGPFELAVGYNPKDPRFQGADQLAYEYAKANGISGRCFPALWDLHGNAAGPIRNRTMLERTKPHVVAAFEGGRGTADMVAIARKAHVHVIEPRWKPAREAAEMRAA